MTSPSLCCGVLQTKKDSSLVCSSLCSDDVTFTVLWHVADKEGLESGVVPSAVPQHALDPRGAVRAHCCPRPLPPRPLQPLRPLQVGEEHGHGGGRPQSVERHVVCVGRSAQQRHWRGYGGTNAGGTGGTDTGGTGALTLGVRGH